MREKQSQQFHCEKAQKWTDLIHLYEKGRDLELIAIYPNGKTEITAVNICGEDSQSTCITVMSAQFTLILAAKNGQLLLFRQQLSSMFAHLAPTNNIS